MSSDKKTTKAAEAAPSFTDGSVAGERSVPRGVVVEMGVPIPKLRSETLDISGMNVGERWTFDINIYSRNIVQNAVNNEKKNGKDFTLKSSKKSGVVQLWRTL